MRQRHPRTGAHPGVFPGQPFPLGATIVDGGTNFAIVADDYRNPDGSGGSGIELCLLDASGQQQAHWELTEQTHGIWHTFIPGVGAGQRYGYRVAAHDAAKLLLDPYARRVDTTEYDLLAASGPGIDTRGLAPLGMVTAPVRSTVAGPQVPWEHTVIYEAHVAGLTRTHPEIPEHLRGTYLGIAHPSVIEHLQSLHITTLELLPVHAFASEPSLVATGRQNYWGYSTLSYFAPHPAYASKPGLELTEFVTMVDALHTAGIEVLLDVVYNHTCEGSPSAPISVSWRGLAPDTYYLADTDLTGCGNTIDPAPLACVRMVTDSLRYWAKDLGVDGFRFDLASVLGRPGGKEFDPQAAMLTAIAADPVLATRKLVAEPWDATGEGYAAGRFGVNWAEWNDAFRDDVRDFWRGTGQASDLAFRLAGSQDRFGDGRRPWSSINYVTSHDGFTLRDLVSYNDKHNRANGENNADGTDNNRSDNNGIEGDTDDPTILAQRQRQARNIAATLLLSTGTPLLNMGDELWRTQDGNNNAYCQDNPISWVDWPSINRPDDPAATMLQFVQRTLAVRSRAVALHQGEFFLGLPGHHGADAPRDQQTLSAAPDLAWFDADGQLMTDDSWHESHRRTLQMWVNGSDITGHGPHGAPQTDSSWLLVLHAGTAPAEVRLPGGVFAAAYEPVLDTGTADGAPWDTRPLAADLDITVPARTFLLLRSLPAGDDQP